MTLLIGLACAPASGRLRDSNSALVSVELRVDSLSAAAFSDTWIDWSGLEHDLSGLELAPEDIDKAELLIFHELDGADVTEGLAQGSLRQSDLYAYRACEAGAGGCGLSDFDLLDQEIDLAPYFDPDQLTWLLVLRDALGAARSLAFLAPAEGAPDEVWVEDGTSQLLVDSDLASRPAVQVQSTLDWSELELDLRGEAIDLRLIDGVRLGRFEVAAEEIEGRLPELELLAAELWTAPIRGQVGLDLSELEGPRPLTALDRDSTWILALDCSTCVMPIPSALVRLEAP